MFGLLLIIEFQVSGYGGLCGGRRRSGFIILAILGKSGQEEGKHNFG